MASIKVDLWDGDNFVQSAETPVLPRAQDLLTVSAGEFCEHYVVLGVELAYTSASYGGPAVFSGRPRVHVRPIAQEASMQHFYKDTK